MHDIDDIEAPVRAPNRRTRRALRPVPPPANVERQNRPDARPAKTARAKRIRDRRRAGKAARKVTLGC